MHPPSDPPIPIHQAVLNLLLLTCPTEGLDKWLRETPRKVERLRYHHARPALIRWLEEIPQNKEWEKEIGRYYWPRTFTCLGNVDLAALYLSPGISQPSPPTSMLLGAGQDIHLCLLPELEPSFNSDFIERYSQPVLASGTEGADLCPPVNERFLGIIKLKLNTPASWPRSADGQNHRFVSRIHDAAAVIETWRDQHDRPLVALGLGMGWSEMMVAAQAGSLSSLFELIWELRKMSTKVPWEDNRDAHVFATSVSHIGYESRLTLALYEEAFERGRETGQEGVLSLEPQALIPAVEEVRRRFGVSAPASGRRDVYAGVSFSVYPGHESRLATLMEKATAPELWQEGHAGALLSASETKGGFRDRLPGPGQLGKFDFSGPVLRTTDRVDDTFILLYSSLLSLWSRREGLICKEGTEAEAMPLTHGFLTTFETDTQVGLLSLGQEGGRSCERAADEDEGLSDSHFPKHHYSGNAAQRAQEIRGWLKKTVVDVTLPMRRLQVPYSRAEQVHNVLAKYLWTMEQDILWEDALPLAPLVLCLRDHLEDLSGWWCERSFQAWRGPLQVEQDSDPFQRTVDELHGTLRRFHHFQLPDLLAAFRANFHHRHLGGYLTEETPDFNLRYRGAVQQLLNLASLILHSASSVLSGDRACVAMIGDSLTPYIETACDVIVVRLHADIITIPILLESLGHEVADVFLSTLVRGAEPADAEIARSYEFEARDRTGWTRGCVDCDAYRKLSAVAAEVRDCVFFGEVDPRGYFIDSMSDLCELRLLGYDTPEDWAPSFCLRQLMASTPLAQDLPAVRRALGQPQEPLVPTPNRKIMRKALHRLVHVVVAWHLGDWSGDQEEWEPFLRRVREGPLESMRDTLHAKCALGTSRTFRLLVGPEDDAAEWSQFVDQALERAPWLQEAASARITRLFVRALLEHIDSRCSSDETLWGEIREEFRHLREAILPHLVGSLHIRHWLNPRNQERGPDGVMRGEHEMGREELEAFLEKQGRGSERLPWRAVPQPAEVYRLQQDGRRPEFKLAIMQRGRIVPLDWEVGTEIRRANNRFIGSLISLLPAWRSTLDEQIRRVESQRQARDDGGAEPVG